MKSYRFAGGVSMLASTLLFVPAAQAAVALSGATYTQNFDSLAATGTNVSTLPAGWEIAEAGNGARDNELYSAGNGSSDTGDTYSFGTGTNTDRALGSVASGSLQSIYGAIFENMTGATITAFTLDYFGEQWRAGSTTPDSLSFQYLVGATSVGAGTWTNFAPLDFTSVNPSSTTALNGNAAANRLAISGTISNLSIANGGTFGIRWLDGNSAGNDDGLGIDDLSLSTQSASAVPEPASWLMMVGGFGLLGAALRRKRTAPHFI